MQDLNDMLLFAKVVEHGGYTAASHALGIPVSRISRRLSALEAELGVRLLNRTTRKISVTDVGQTYYQHCAALVAEASAARDAVERTTAQPQGLVRMSCPVGLLQSGVDAIVADYQLRYPRVRVMIEATARRVDVVEEGFDLALRVRQPPYEDSDLVVRPLATASQVLAATPGFVAEHGPIETPADIAGVPTVSMVQRGERYTWRLIDPDGKAVSVPHVPRLAVDELSTLHVALLRGVGLACIPRQMVRADLEAGRLVQLLPGYTVPEGTVQAVFASRRGLVPAVRELVDMLVHEFDWDSCS
jgi:DNA-binding transcriptional LysR family regulator